MYSINNHIICHSHERNFWQKQRIKESLIFSYLIIAGQCLTIKHMHLISVISMNKNP